MIEILALNGGDITTNDRVYISLNTGSTVSGGSKYMNGLVCCGDGGDSRSITIRCFIR